MTIAEPGTGWRYQTPIGLPAGNPASAAAFNFPSHSTHGGVPGQNLRVVQARKENAQSPAYLFEACRLMSIKPGLHDQSYLPLMTPSWISWQHAREPGPVPRIPWRCTSCLSSPVEASVVRSTRLTGREAVRLVQLLLSLDITLPSQNIIRSVGSNRHPSSISFYKYHSDKTCFGCGYIWNLRHIQVTLTTILCLEQSCLSLHFTVVPDYGTELLHLV